MISHLLSELLRRHWPADRIGLTRAAFFARRAFVNSIIVELLIREGRVVAALENAESAKARAFEDALSHRRVDAQPACPKTRPVRESLKHWPPGVAAIEYFLGLEGAWVFVIDIAGQVKVYPLLNQQQEPVSPDSLIDAVTRWLQSVRYTGKRMLQRYVTERDFDQSWQKTLSEFRQTLLPSEALTTLRQAETVVVVPQHVLHYFPFAALVCKLDDSPRLPNAMVKPRFLVDEPFSLCYAPSLVAWCDLRAETLRPMGQVAAIGIADFPGQEQLPGVTKDMQCVADVFGERVRQHFIGKEARRARAQLLLGQPGLVLAATHGSNLADCPLASFLTFYADDDTQRDGHLTATAIYEQHVAADLVVLSACFSGIGERSPPPGDDLFGLQRALMHSGAQTVVSALWDVNDETAPQLMGIFFREMAAGRPAAAAMANAQRTLLSTLRNSTDVEPGLHPYFWAVFTVAGDDRTLCETR
jgi:CHAT domain-containing protein